MDYTPQELLKSNNQVYVAMGLANLFADTFADTQKEFADAIQSLEEIIWNIYNVRPADDYVEAQRKKKQAAKDVGEVFDTFHNPEDKKKLAEAYVRLGHLYEIAGHAARENFFLDREKICETAVKGLRETDPAKRILERNQVVGGGIHDLLFVENNENTPTNPFIKMSVGDVVRELSTPVSEYVFTQHPTNTNTLESMNLQREIAKQVEAVTRQLRKGQTLPDLSKLKSSIAEFAKVPLVQENNFTVKDETDICINFLTNAYHDIDRLYEVTERALQRKFLGQYDDTQRQNLDLKIRFGSWGSAGDKDGNSNIKSENTLEAIVMHKQKAAELLLGSLRDDGIIWNAEIATWARKLEKANQAYTALFKEIESNRNGNDIPLTNELFAQYSDKAKDIAASLGNVENFKNTLEAGIKQESGERKDKLLSILRKTRIFGFNLGKIEYRETAEEYGRALAYIFSRVEDNSELKDNAAKYIEDQKLYSDLLKKKEKEKDDNTKIELSKQIDDLEKALLDNLDIILSTKNLRDDFIAHSQKILSDMKGQDLRSLSEDEAIAYHSLRRMELARDFDDIITHNVLAECKGAHNMLEALALQYAVTDNGGKRARMHIVPLFEEAETMAKIPDVLKYSLANDVYRQHVEELRNLEKTEQITQQIQIAHSDNARRAGAIASRGIIHEGHVAARDAILEYNKGKDQKDQINLQFFEGGSLSDSYRNGVRAHTAMIEDFGLAKFGKFTFQGGDLLNYFNQPSSIERLLLRGLVKQTEMMNGISKNHVDPKLEAKIRSGLKNLQGPYDADVYEKAPGNPIGRLLYELGYRGHLAAGNAGSRGGSRTIDNTEEDKKRAIDATVIRTIGFSETLQHEGIHPTFMGAGDIRAVIEDELKEGNLSAARLKELYEKSPSFKDVVDKLSYSIVNSDLRRPMEKLYFKAANDPTLYDLTKNYSGWQEKHQKLLEFVREELPKQYIDAAKLVYEAKTGEKFTDNDIPLHREIHQLQVGEFKGKINTAFIDAADRIKFVITNLDSMKHLEPLNYKRRFVEGVQVVEKALKDSMKQVAEGAQKMVGDASIYLSRLFHNAVDTFTHGRTFMADDPTYRASYIESKNQKSLSI